jgi:hypothetical protein
VSSLHLDNFMFAIAMKSGPFYSSAICITPIKKSGMTMISHFELTTYKNLLIARPRFEH